MSRRRRKAGHVNHERWLVSYADFITLMFAFFVVLFSSAQVDQRKVGMLALAIQVAFQEMGIFPSSNTQMPLKASEPMPFAEVQMVENVQRNNSMARLVDPLSGVLSNATPNRDLSDLQREFEKALDPEIKRNEVAMKTGREGLVISLREVGFFDSGSSSVRTSALPAIGKIAALLAGRPEHIRIEGHTDNIPIHTDRFASNWELSTARATEITKIFIVAHGIAPTRLSAAGYAEYHPTASNATEQGRAVNRRIDIVILRPNVAEEDRRPLPSGQPGSAVSSSN